MAGRSSPSLKELARRYWVTLLVRATDLKTGMVLLVRHKPRIVISVAYENSVSGPMVVVETVDGLERIAVGARVEVWHIAGKPFFVDVPPEDLGPYMVASSRGGSTPPAHDAAGIVPVWRGPKRLN
jgi:hypothetical protein